jgi:catechol 2,3-dioxygenase-like lactoylglutathione lyase family enzyme
MRSIAIFAAGIAVGMFMMRPSAAQPADSGLKLNHVGISVKNFDEELKFYTQTLGFREAFMVPGPDGKPFLAYVQLSRDTFLELQPANADRPPGVSHIGLQVNDLNTSISVLRQRGVKVDAARPAATKATLSNFFDPEGVRFELVEFLPESLQRKAIDAWK